MKDTFYVFSAYASVWAVLFIYVFVIERKLSRLTDEITVLKEVLKKKTV